MHFIIYKFTVESKEEKGVSTFQEVERLWTKVDLLRNFTYVNFVCFLRYVTLLSLKDSLEQILRSYHPSDFSLLIVSYHAAKREKNSFPESYDLSLHNFEPQSGQNCPFGLKDSFLGDFAPVIFIYLFNPIIL